MLKYFYEFPSDCEKFWPKIFLTVLKVQDLPLQNNKKQ